MGGRQWAVGNGQLAVGSRQEAVGRRVHEICLLLSASIHKYSDVF
jgi:hypothetical protein